MVVSLIYSTALTGTRCQRTHQQLPFSLWAQETPSSILPTSHFTLSLVQAHLYSGSEHYSKALALIFPSSGHRSHLDPISSSLRTNPRNNRQQRTQVSSRSRRLLSHIFKELL